MPGLGSQGPGAVSVVPVLILFGFAQKYFISGIQLTGLTGR